MPAGIDVGNVEQTVHPGIGTQPGRYGDAAGGDQAGGRVGKDGNGQTARRAVAVGHYLAHQGILHGDVAYKRAHFDDAPESRRLERLVPDEDSPAHGFLLDGGEQGIDIDHDFLPAADIPAGYNVFLLDSLLVG